MLPPQALGDPHWRVTGLVAGILSFLLPPAPTTLSFFQMNNDRVIPLSSLCNHPEKLIVTLLMTARSDVNVPGDGLQCPAFCSPNAEGSQGGQAGHGCKVGRQRFIQTVVMSAPFLHNAFCLVSPAPGWQCGGLASCPCPCPAVRKRAGDGGRDQERTQDCLWL